MITRNTSASLSFRLDSVEIIDPGEAISPILKEEFSKGTQQSRSLTLHLGRNTTDRYIDPSRGVITSYSIHYTKLYEARADLPVRCEQETAYIVHLRLRVA